MEKLRTGSTVMIEALEGRQLLSTTILGPSAVEGNYKGETIGGKATELKLTITATSVTLTAVGKGTDTVALTAKQFKKLREGTFAFSGKISKYDVTFDGSVADDGARIAGTFSAIVPGDSADNGSGTFVVKKA